ncbi:hypothetical protein MPDQ_007854 [Monascus purpureus]|uniref:Zn(2)-C6 fungal-type domain-containing protein n=1 Tax=Monascus purpureus TaxID=5098 RepID=A0A507R646_MONPU|nr:hypothetical protein MPDQ_007854 [Monascus purpureus]BDD62959.1 hypothetical protein MAP00_007910 [Monascus purpureus]
MRSSIACARCRRSKIKCVNAGIDTTCRACESSGRECVYPTPAIGAGGGAAKRDIGAVADGEDRNAEWDGPKRQRPRRSVGMSAAKDAAKAHVEALDSSILTLKTWETAIDLFQSHFATLLPFLHPATFLSHLRQLSTPDSSSAGRSSHSPPAPKTEPSPFILLGILTLTARFHPQLVAYHSPSTAGNPSNPLVASEFYARTLRSRLAGADAAGLCVPDLTRVQAFLMLALHEWGMCRGKSAWVYVGVAIRLAQAMGLPFELDNDLVTGDAQWSAAGLKSDPENFGSTRRVDQREQTSDEVIALETKRRTFWSCFLLDRCLSTGKYRPRIIRVKDLNIQLPSDNAFAFGERVRTSRLSEPSGRRPTAFGSQSLQIPSLRHSLGFADDKMPANGPQDAKAWSPVSRRKDSGEEDIDRWETGAEEPVLSRVIRIIRVWGSLVKWSCAGGRRTEQYPPWHPDSHFNKLRSMLADFQDGLPRNLQYSPRNTDTHMYRNTLAPYMMMHAIYFLSTIMLHRSYLPFLPLRCSEPMGPLDDPFFPIDKMIAPDGFWQENAKELFRTAREMIDLAVSCQERGALVENCLVGFAIYNAVLVGVYASHFPHMDQEGFLSPKSTSGEANAGQIQALRKALDILRHMRPRLKMATGWFRTLNRVHSYFSKVKRDSTRSGARKIDIKSDPGDQHANGVRSGSVSGPEEVRVLEKLFLEFGIAEDQLPETGAEEDTAMTTDALPDQVTNASDAGSTTARSDLGDGREPLPLIDSAGNRRESWVTINGSNVPLPGPDLERRPSLPMPPGLPRQSPPYTLPSLQHPDGPIFSTTSPSLRSIAAPSPSYASPPTSQAPAQYLGAPSTRLQPINSWLTSRQQAPPPPPSYSQSLPPINASSPSSLAMLPPPGAVNYGVTSPPATDSGDNGAQNVVCFGGDDLLAFLDGCECEQWPSMTTSEIGIPAGWLSTVWGELGR